MNAFLLRWTVAMLTLMCASDALADGKMFAEKVPATIPYQRAIILHTGETQTLVLQSQYQIPGASDTKALGWVVPVPATPQITSVPAEQVERTFMHSDLATTPSVLWIKSTLISLLLSLPFVSCAVCFFCAIANWRGNRRRWFYRTWIYFWLSFLVMLGVAVLAPLAGKTAGVETLKSQQAGIYDVKVIRAKAAADVLAWLNENAFRFGPDDEAAVQAYLDKGWVFTVAKIRPSAEPASPSPFSEGLADPLILGFPTTSPIYPLALTATGGHDTEVLIYLASDVPRIGDDRLPLRYSGPENQDVSHELRSLMHRAILAKEGDFWLKNVLSGKFGFARLAKFKGTLTPEQMRKDLEFLPDPNQTDYREHIYRW
ncbi:MAG: DUF2330 domain-containing protein [Verrucomicrobia bacterium]|nr:DUF2330 domain-containing protein [Verrucomicrobiota bacterium]